MSATEPYDSALPARFDYVDLAELLDLLDHLLDFTRAGTFDEAPGEYELFHRARAVLDRYRPAT